MGEYFPPRQKGHLSDINNTCSYKYMGPNITDARGTPDINEVINISKDDVISWPTPTHRTYPLTVNARMESTIIPFVRKSLDVTNTLLNVLNDRLGLPKGAIAKRHSVMEYSGCEARCIKSPKTMDIPSDSALLGAHADYGSLVGGENRCSQ